MLPVMQLHKGTYPPWRQWISRHLPQRVQIWFYIFMKRGCMCRTWQLLMRLATPRTLAISSRQGCWSKTQLLAKTKPRLIWAADSGNLGAVELLLSAGVDDTAKGFMVEALQKFEMVSKALIVCPQTWCPHVVFMAHGRCEGRVCCGPALTCMGSTSNIIIIPAKCNTLWFPRAAWGLALSCGILWGGAGWGACHPLADFVAFFPTHLATLGQITSQQPVLRFLGKFCPLSRVPPWRWVLSCACCSAVSSLVPRVHVACSVHQRACRCSENVWLWGLHAAPKW